MSQGESPVLLLRLLSPGFVTDSERLQDINNRLCERLKSFTYTEELEKAPEATIVLENEDLYWIDEQGGADGVAEGTIIQFQFGYVNTISDEEPRLSLPRFHVISSKPHISRDTMVIKAVSPIQAILGAVLAPQWHLKVTASSLVRKLLQKAGFDSLHRRIQDSVIIEDGFCSSTRETLLEFIYRIARPYNFRFYLTPGPDGKPIAHFHKPGWVSSERVPLKSRNRAAGPVLPASDELLALIERAKLNAQRPVSDEDLVALEKSFRSGGAFDPTATAQLSKKGAAFSVKGNGNIAPTKGVIRYRPAPPMDSIVMGWSIAFEADGTPANMQSAGVDTNEGKPHKEITNTINVYDKDEEPLSPRTPYRTDSHLPLPLREGRQDYNFFTPRKKFELDPQLARLDTVNQQAVRDLLERRRITQRLRIGLRAADPNLVIKLQAEKPELFNAPNAVIQDLPVEEEKFVDFPDIPGGLFGISATGFAIMSGVTGEQSAAYAKAYLERAQSAIVQLTLDLRGVPNMDSGDIWRTEGFKIYSQRYLVKKVTHTLVPGSGFKTNAVFTSDGVNSRTQEASKPKGQEDDGDKHVGFKDTGYQTVLQVANNDGSAVDPEGAPDEKLKNE